MSFSAREWILALALVLVASVAASASDDFAADTAYLEGETQAESESAADSVAAAHASFTGRMPFPHTADTSTDATGGFYGWPTSTADFDFDCGKVAKDWAGVTKAAGPSSRMHGVMIVKYGTTVKGFYSQSGATALIGAPVQPAGVSTWTPVTSERATIAQRTAMKQSFPSGGTSRCFGEPAHVTCSLVDSPPTRTGWVIKKHWKGDGSNVHELGYPIGSCALSKLALYLKKNPGTVVCAAEASPAPYTSYESVSGSQGSRAVRYEATEVVSSCPSCQNFIPTILSTFKPKAAALVATTTPKPTLTSTKPTLTSTKPTPTPTSSANPKPTATVPIGGTPVASSRVSSRPAPSQSLVRPTPTRTPSPSTPSPSPDGEWQTVTRKRGKGGQGHLRALVSQLAASHNEHSLAV